MKIGDEVYVHGYVDEMRKDVVIIRNDGGYFGTAPSEIIMADRKDEPTTQTETQNSNLTFEKDECAKEYEELGLKELKELINADRKTENGSEIPNNSTISKMEQVDEPQYEMGMGTLRCDNCSEYGSFKCTKCDGEMYFKRLEPKDEPQTDCAWAKGE